MGDVIDNDLGFDQPLDRRTLLGKAAIAGGALAAGGLLTAPCVRRLGRGRRQGHDLVRPVRSDRRAGGNPKYVFKGFNGEVDAGFAPITAPTLFVDRVRAEAKAAGNDIDVLVGLHGDFVTFQNEGLIRGVGDVAAQIKTLPPALVKHGKLGTKTQYYVPHSQATYVMVANKDVMRYPPRGADINAITYGQLFQWAAIRRGTGQNRFGLPASETGLMHRFLQGFPRPLLHRSLRHRVPLEGGRGGVGVPAPALAVHAPAVPVVRVHAGSAAQPGGAAGITSRG